MAHPRILGVAMLAAATAMTLTAASCKAGGGAVTSICDYAPSGKPKGKLGLNAEQADNALTVIRAAAERRLPRRAAVIAIGTTLQESNLKNSVVGDNGTAFGIFQQRPVSGWGTVGTATDPYMAAGKFYARLKKVSGWEFLPLTVAAQKVQRSAFPNAYAKHEGRAERIVDILAGRDCKGAK